MRAASFAFLACAGCIFGENPEFEGGPRELCDDRDNDTDGIVDEYSTLNEVCRQCTLGALDGSSYFFCYGRNDMVEPLSRSWEAAQMVCQGFGSGVDLASVGTEAENRFIEEHLDAASWLGGLLPGTWVDGTPFDYTNWLMGQPDETEQRSHIRMEESGKWTTANPETLAGFVCKVEDPM